MLALFYSYPLQLTVAEAESSTFKSYVNSTYGYSIQYPSNWIAKDFFIYRLFLAPYRSANSSEQFSPNVLVGVTPAPVKMSVERINGLIINSLNRLNNFHLISSNDVTLAGNPAHLFFFTHVQSIVGIIAVIEVWMIKHNKTYSIIFSALPDQLHNYISTLQKMIDSFKLQ
jgi:hypothetical protein